MKTFKRLAALALSFAILISVAGCTEAEPLRFDRFIEQEFTNTMQQSYLNTHIFLENPQKYGIDKSKLTIQIDEPLSDETFAAAKEGTKKSAAEFKKFNRSALSPEQQETYDCYKYLLQINEESNNSKYDYLFSPLESMNGIHTQIPTLLADWVLRDEQDVKGVITLMKTIPEYINSVIDYTKKQEVKGTLMIDVSSVKSYCEKIISNKENSSVVTGLNKSIDELKLGDEKSAAYKNELKAAFLKYFIPAYQDIVNTMNEIDQSKNNTLGLSNIKNGKEYYELLFKQASGSDETVEETKKELTALMGKSLLSAQTAVSKNPQIYDAYANDTIKTSYKDFDSMLKDLSTSTADDFPSVGELQYNIYPIGEDLASGGVAAYFNLPAIDSTKPKQIRVNMLSNALDISSLSTFSTVAHEGIPGHMYQTAYTYKNVKYPWRNTVADFIGYSEGYATYVELYALKYLNGISKESIQLHCDMAVYQNCMIALADIGIHYDGWTKAETQKFFETNGMSVSNIDPLFYQLQANPTAFIPYYVGYMQFAQLKENAQNQLNDEFNDKEFHEAILKSGSAPFSIVEKNVQSYIDSKNSTSVTPSLKISVISPAFIGCLKTN